MVSDEATFRNGLEVEEWLTEGNAVDFLLNPATFGSAVEGMGLLVDHSSSRKGGRSGRLFQSHCFGEQ